MVRSQLFHIPQISWWPFTYPTIFWVFMNIVKTLVQKKRSSPCWLQRAMLSEYILSLMSQSTDNMYLYFPFAKKLAEEVAWLPLGSDWQSRTTFHMLSDLRVCAVPQCAQLPLPRPRAGHWAEPKISETLIRPCLGSEAAQFQMLIWVLL